MPGAGMESLHNIRYNIHSPDSPMNSHNGYVRVDYHSSPDFYRQKPIEEGPIDFSLKPNSEVRAKSPEINIEHNADDSESYRSAITIANHLPDRNYGKIKRSMLEQHLRNGNGFTNGNPGTHSPVYEAPKFESKHYEEATSPSHFNAQPLNKMYYETSDDQKTSEGSVNRSQASNSQFAKPFSEDHVEHHLNAGHYSEAEYGSTSALHHGGVHYAYSRNSIDKKSEVVVNGTFPTHEFPEKRSNSPEATTKQEEYCPPKSVTKSKNFNSNKRHSAGGSRDCDRDSVAINDNARRNRVESSGMQSNPKSSPVKSKYGGKEVAIVDPDTQTRFQSLLSANAGPYLPTVYGNMGIMNPTVTSNFPHLNPLSYPPTMLNSFNPFLSPTPLAHTLNPMSTVSYDRKSDKNERPFKQLANELIFGMPTMLPVKPPHVDRSYASATEPTSSTMSPQPERPMICWKDRTPSTERSSPSAVPSTSQATTSDESANSVSPTYHENDARHSQPEQKEDDDSNLAKEDEKEHNDSNSSFSDAMSNNQQPPDTSSGNGKRRSLPDHMKNDLYWAKRRKNNAAAKRSRDARRKKEDMLAITAKTLRDQNYQFQILMAAMQEQINFQSTENKRLSEKCNSQEIQIYRLKEDQERNQKLCRRCSTRILDADASGL